jgi:signal transduction histidine kinase
MVKFQRWTTALGVGLWAVACWRTVLAILGLTSGHHDVSGSRGVAYLVAFALFGAALGAELGRPLRSTAAARRIVALQLVAALVMVVAVPRYLNELVLVYVAWQLGFHFPVRSAIALTAVQAAAMLQAIAGVSTWNDAASQVVFQVMALTSSLIAMRELRTRRNLEVVNAQLASTRDQLADRTRAAERGRIARELHDTIGHHLTALSLQLELAAHRSDGDAREAVIQSQRLTRAMLGDVRAVVSAFDERVIGDVPAALHELIHGFKRPRAHLALRGDLVLADADAATAHVLVRCVQEMLTNVLKHASAANVWIDVSREGSWIEARVSDDGTPTPPAATGGRGLAGMTERLAELGGELAITRQPVGGWTVTARLPVSARPA